MRIKVLYLIPSLVFAGAEKVVVDLANGLDKEKFDVYIISLSDNVPLSKKLNEDIKLFSMGASFTFPWISIKIIKKLKDIVVEINPDVIHSHIWSILTSYLLFISNNNTLNFHTIHIDGSHYRSKKIIYRIFKKIEVFICKYNRYRIISISDAVSELCLNHLGFKDVVKISNGIDTQIYTPPKIGRKAEEYDQNIIKVIHVGRYDPQKEHITIINAMRYLVYELQEKRVIVQLIGKDVELALTNLVKQYRLNDFVHFLGMIDNVEKYYEQAQIGIFPSNSEGLPLTLGEKLSSELPCIITNIKPSLQLTDNGKNAIVIGVGDYKELALSIKKIIDTPDIYLEMAKSARSFIKSNYSIERNVELHQEIYSLKNKI